MTTAIERKRNLETILGGVAGCTVELTVRGQRSFTVSYDGINAEREQRLMAYLGSRSACRVEHIDDHLDNFTAIFFDVL